MKKEISAVSKKLDVIFERTAQKLPGKQLIAHVERGDGEVRWSAAAGKASDGSAVTSETPYFIASIDKLMNAALLLQLAEKKIISLDAPMVEYLPEAFTDGLHVFKGTDYTPKITLRHLITHTSGLADWYEDFPKDGKNLVEEIIVKGDRDLAPEEMLDYVRIKLTPNFEPQPIKDWLGAISANQKGGSGRFRIKTRYTDTGFILICIIIEAVTGQPLEKLHHDLIYSPLGMNHTWLAHRTNPAADVNSHLPLLAAGKPVEIPKMLRSVWGVYSTAEDMITFLKALFHGKLFNKPETRELMFSGWHRFGFPTDRASVRLPGWPIAYSHGAMHFRLPRLFSPMKPIPEVTGHTGSSGCWLFYCPQQDLYFAGAADDLTAGALPFRIVPAMLKLFI